MPDDASTTSGTGDGAPAPDPRGADPGPDHPDDAPDPSRTGDARDPAGVTADPDQRNEAPILVLTLWPHRSLTTNGFAWVVALVAAGLAAPLLALAGSAAAWGLLPFLVATLLALYAAIQRNYADGRLTEELRLWPDLITVVRREPNGLVRRWRANPTWVRLQLFEHDRIEKYLTLTGGGREIELGAFLSPDEREALYRDIGAALGALRMRPGPT